MFFQIRNSEKDKHLSLLRQAGLPTTGSGWWVEYPKRATEEVYRIIASTNAKVSYRRDKMIIEETISNNFEREFLISIEVQDFPFRMPKVFLKKPEIKKRKHMWKDGSLCLMDPDEFHSNMSILEIRNLAAAWCFCAEVFVQTGEWPAAEH